MKVNASRERKREREYFVFFSHFLPFAVYLSSRITSRYPAAYSCAPGLRKIRKSRSARKLAPTTKFRNLAVLQLWQALAEKHRLHSVELLLHCHFCLPVF